MAEFSLDEILADDPLELLGEARAKAKTLNEDDRLLVSFEEINAFIEQEGHEPKKSANMSERNLFSRLEGIRQNPEKIEFLKPYDSFNILQKVEINSIDDILNDDVFGLLENENSEDIFTLKHVPKNSDIVKPDYIATRKSCKNFEKYEPLFKEVQNDLKTGKRALAKFENEQEIYEDEFYILKGVMVYVASKGRLVKKNGKTNTRLYCIYENGTESSVLMRSLSRELYRDGKRVSRHEDKLLENLQMISKKDSKSGYIYILESLSIDDKISSIKNLYKIGYSTTDVKERIKNAINEPTYLMAPVRIVTVYEAYNMNTQKFEQLIHRFFGKVCLNVDIFGDDGKRYTPREWFILPLDIIEQVIELIITGEIVNYRYDEKNEELVLINTPHSIY
ncbi:GIY-YIG nuclease family protein [Sulfurimonas sp.]|uniref:GIY-YIG nuclease family protein n=1 Tax=Sulfurimonas sp. TaxID=2022749 RepID=UPI0019E59DC8|nr:GIY-YIG nuclease family protein [Sulfurimonas sp.]MBE0515373.1 GIY-YIG nuclease family protein [Sulfurimonas sp.]